MFRRGASTLLAGLLGALVAVSACGGSAGGGAQSRQPTTIKVGVLPIADVAPLYVGMREGFFKQQNLVVKPQLMQGGAAVASAVLGGSLDFGFAATVNLLLARGQGLPVKIVASGNNAASDPAHAWSAIMVLPDSPIKSVKDLAGKTIAANALKGVNELAIDGIVKRAGVDPGSLKIVPVDFPDMPAALSQKRVDAVSVPEPFLTQIKASGGRMISPLFEGYLPGMTVGTYFTTDKEIQEHPALVRAFVEAIQRSLTYASAHPDVARQAITTYTRIPASVIPRMELSPWDAKLNRPSIVQTEQLMRQLGWLKSDVDVNSLIWSGAS
ncbi:MAG TPA: ABC transporter substrate-binding protein [Candidatus Dormibacteraeota bacterium]|jgi:NitT/TauT family transport system substrate-binding protein|nr:ABC transporter substrate-binding protein [Candidatus Dormibacteraeota bacterium]